MSNKTLKTFSPPLPVSLSRQADDDTMASMLADFVACPPDDDDDDGPSASNQS